MHNPGFSAKLTPDRKGAMPGFGDVGRVVGHLRAVLFSPVMLVLRAYTLPGRFVSVRMSKVEGVNPPRWSMYQSIGQSGTLRTIPAGYKKRIAGIRGNFSPKLHRARVLRVRRPHNIARNPLAGVGQDGGKFRLCKHQTAPAVLVAVIILNQPQVAGIAEFVAGANRMNVSVQRNRFPLLKSLNDRIVSRRLKLHLQPHGAFLT